MSGKWKGKISSTNEVVWNTSFYTVFRLHLYYTKPLKFIRVSFKAPNCVNARDVNGQKPISNQEK